MSGNIIDELVVLVKLNSKPLQKGLTEQVEAVQAAKKKINISAEDQERIDNSRAVRVKKREDDQVKRQKQRDRDKAKSAQELGGALKDVAFGIGGAILGFETIKGAVGFLGNLVTSTAALGRTSANLGLSSVGLQAWGNSVKLAGGDASEAQASFAALSQQMTAFKLTGAVGPLLAAAQNNGVYTRDAQGNTKSIDQLLPEIVDAVNKRYNRADAFNLLSAAGVSEGLYNLLSDPNRASYIAKGKSTAFADDAAVKESQRLTAIRAAGRQKVDKFVANGAMAAEAAIDKHPLTSIAGGAFGVARYLAGDLYQQIFGEKAATLGVSNNNPGNLKGKDGNFRRFVTMAEGDAAMSSDIDYKIDRDGLNTVRKILSKYNPATLDKNGKDTNHLAEYIAQVSKETGLDPDAPITTREQRFKIHEAMINREQGRAGAAQVSRAISTPGVGAGATTTNGGDTTLHVGTINVNAPNARDASGVANGITTALDSRLTSQSNVGITP